jgi:hypothetical protein
MNQDFETLRAVSEYMTAQRAWQREAVRDAVKASSVPIPQAIVGDIALLNPSDALDVLKDHPGFKIWRRWKSYLAALALFERAMADLFDAINALVAAMREENLFARPHRHRLDEGVLRVHKELFAAGNAAHSLKDHASYRLQDVVQIAAFKAKLAEHFGHDGLHDFVIGLRTITHHIDVVEPNLHITRRFGSNGDAIAFHLDREKLRAIVDSVKADSGKYQINKPGRVYLDKAPAKIDVRCTYEDYLRRARGFHGWFRGLLESQPPAELQDFERCLKANSDMAERTWWKALLGNWLNWDIPPNPYDHLARFLTAEQLEEVNRLPKKSQQQVDKIVALVDDNGACDDELRQRAYELFRRAPD